VTIIAWDGKTLAADRRMVNYSVIFSTTKIFRVGGALVGFSGTAAHIGRYLAWMRDGFDPKTYPEQDKECTCYSVVIRADGSIESYGDTGYPVLVSDPFHAAGSGRDFALAAMYLGKGAREAVELTCHFCCDCGSGIDTLSFDEPVAPNRSEAGRI